MSKTWRRAENPECGPALWLTVTHRELGGKKAWKRLVSWD